MRVSAQAIATTKTKITNQNLIGMNMKSDPERTKDTQRCLLWLPVNRQGPLPQCVAPPIPLDPHFDLRNSLFLFDKKLGVRNGSAVQVTRNIFNRGTAVYSARGIPMRKVATAI